MSGYEFVVSLVVEAVKYLGAGALVHVGISLIRAI